MNFAMFLQEEKMQMNLMSVEQINFSLVVQKL